MIYFSNRFFRLLLFFVFVALPVLAFDEYNVVLKKNGKVIKGKYVREDQQYIYILSGGVQVNFKKSILDLEKMKELNAVKDNVVAKPDSNPVQESNPVETQSPLAAVAEKARKSKTGKSKVFTDADRSKAAKDEESEQKEKEPKDQPKNPEAAGYLETIGNLEKEIERLEQELMDAKIENQDTRAVEKLLEDTKDLRDRRQSEYEEILRKKPDERLIRKTNKGIQAEQSSGT
jgi:hypothetical protein